MLKFRIRFNTYLAIVILSIVVMFVAEIYAAQVNPRTVQYRGGTNAPMMVDVTLRDSAILTNSYVATNYARVADVQDLGIWFDLEQGSLTSFEYKIQWSRDGETWFDEVTETVTPGSITDTTLEYDLTFGGDVQSVKPITNRGNYVRLSVKGTGTVTNSTCVVYLTGVSG